MNQLEQAQQVLQNTQNTIFFNKLASLGIKPQTQQQALGLLKEAAALLEMFPREVPQTQRAMKSASFKVFPNQTSEVCRDGYSQDTHQVVDTMMTNPELVKCAALILNS
jgi:hypothetical protein